jgi:outer membrane protein assembly factor BamA
VLARYPFSRFVFLQGSVAAGGAEYFLLDDTRKALVHPDESLASRNLYAPWLDDNSGLRFQTEGTLAFGYNTIGMHRATGPIRGSSSLLSLSVGTQPWHDQTYEQLRFDGEHYFPLVGAVNLFTRAGAGATFGHERAPQYFLSSFHTLRGVPFGDTDYLLGRDFVYGTLELQFPILELISFPLIDLEGVLGIDAGAVADDAERLWRRRLLDLVFGTNLGFGPIVVQIHFGQPIDIGPIRPPNDGDLTFNLSLNWRYQ